MKVHFYKYQATGNDFILIDNRKLNLTLSSEQITQICHRKFGIGADGLILIEHADDSDFSVNYFNSDGSQSLCGNGSRAAVHFASYLNIVQKQTDFLGYDGKHEAEILANGQVRLKMNDVKAVSQVGNDYFANTGSPHVVRFVDEVESYPVLDEGKGIRNSDTFKPGGTNVNFVQLLPQNTIFVRTFERGVENETLSCGTGVVASALASSLKGYSSPVNIKTLGGSLSVEFKSSLSGIFTDIFLIGPAKMVFEGDLEL